MSENKGFENDENLEDDEKVSFDNSTNSSEDFSFNLNIGDDSLLNWDELEKKFADDSSDEYEVEETEEVDVAQENNGPTYAEKLFDWIDSFVIAMVAVILIFTFFFGKVKVDGSSMLNTLHDKEQLLISNFLYEPKVSDIIIVSRNRDNKIPEGDEVILEPIVKRIIAVGGQTVEIKDGVVYVDDKALKEDYTKDGFTDNKSFEGKQTVPEGHLFVLGDNRLDSHDSRMGDIGFVDKRYVLGKVLVRIYPFDSITMF